MPLDHTKATARLELDGLALVCFNSTKKWEAAFLRRADHELRLTVLKKDITGLKPDTTLFDAEIAGDVREITISTIKGKSPYTMYPKGFWTLGKDFARKQTVNHPEDFRWVVDMANDLPDSDLAVKTQAQITADSGPPITLVTMSDALFYTAERSKEMLSIADFTETGNTPPLIDSFQTLGFTNELVGADIKCEKDGGAVRIEIKLPGLSSIIIDAPHEAGWYYLIILSNMDKPEGPVSKLDAVSNLLAGDFGNYYEVLASTGKRYDLWGTAKSAVAGGAARLTDCNVARLTGVSTLKPG